MRAPLVRVPEDRVAGEGSRASMRTVGDVAYDEAVEVARPFLSPSPAAPESPLPSPLIRDRLM